MPCFQGLATPAATATKPHRMSNKNKVFTSFVIFLDLLSLFIRWKQKKKKEDGLGGHAVHVIRTTSKCCENGKALPPLLYTEDCTNTAVVDVT